MNIACIILGPFWILMAMVIHLVKDKTYPRYGNTSDPVGYFKSQRNIFLLIGTIVTILGLIL